MYLDQAERTRQIDHRLREVHGAPAWSPARDAIGELVATILSQNTSDLNSMRAYASLKRSFPTWQELIDSPSDAVADSIRSGGLANTKAPRIQAAVSQLLERFPDGDLTPLTELSVECARRELTAIPGVGMKTSSCVLLFSLGMPAMPVDTHIHRVAGRTGMIPAGASADAAHAILESHLDGTLSSSYAFHLNCIAHGREICSARSPACEICPIQALCHYFSGS